MVIKKLTKPAFARRDVARTPTAVAHRRARSHSLAPEHIGEAGSVALLAVSIVGLALFITGIAILISGVTMGSRYTGTTPPPNLASLGTGPIIGGALLSLFSVVLVGAAAAVLADVGRARPVAAALCAVGALLGTAGVVIVMSQAGGDQVLAGALVVLTVIFAASALVLFRTPR